MDDILFERRGAVGVITLNRPKVLNALSHAMIKALRSQLFFWAKDDTVKSVVIRGEGPRAFCAGGDIRAFHDSAARRDFKVQQFWRDEYSLMVEIKRYPKPYVALLHGISMGGGLGVSLHGSYRIADTSLVLAMPETGIGFFPDVGASWFLSRMPGETGFYLGMTGARIGLADAYALGLVTHALAQEKWPDLIEALAAGEVPADLLRNACPDDAPPPLAVHRDEIAAAFSADTVAETLARLDASKTGWAGEAAAVIRSRAPMSVKVARTAIETGRSETRFEACMRMEFRVACRMAERPDFLEGIRATVVDKDGKPRWSPASLDAVSAEDVTAVFAPMAGDELDI